MPLKVRVRAKIQLTFLDYLLQELVVVRGGVQVYHPSLLKNLINIRATLAIMSQTLGVWICAPSFFFELLAACATRML